MAKKKDKFDALKDRFRRLFIRTYQKQPIQPERSDTPCQYCGPDTRYAAIMRFCPYCGRKLPRD